MPYFYVKSSNESAEEMSSKQDLIDAIYFCQILELPKNPQKKFSSKQKSHNLMPYVSVKSWNESAEEKCEQTKISPKPYIFLCKSSNKSAEEMSRKTRSEMCAGCFRRDFANTSKNQQRIEVGQIFLVFVVKWGILILL